MRKRLVLKSLISAVIIGGYTIASNVLYPVMTNEQALKQMEDSTGSYTDLSLYTQLWNYAWIVPAVICVCIFWTEIRTVLSKGRGGF